MPGVDLLSAFHPRWVKACSLSGLVHLYQDGNSNVFTCALLLGSVDLTPIAAGGDAAVAHATFPCCCCFFCC